MFWVCRPGREGGDPGRRLAAVLHHAALQGPHLGAAPREPDRRARPRPARRVRVRRLAGPCAQASRQGLARGTRPLLVAMKLGSPGRYAHIHQHRRRGEPHVVPGLRQRRRGSPVSSRASCSRSRSRRASARTPGPATSASGSRTTTRSAAATRWPRDGPRPTAPNRGTRQADAVRYVGIDLAWGRERPPGWRCSTQPARLVHAERGADRRRDRSGAGAYVEGPLSGRHRRPALVVNTTGSRDAEKALTGTSAGSRRGPIRRTPASRNSPEAPAARGSAGGSDSTWTRIAAERRALEVYPHPATIVLFGLAGP